jgi:hypothetical protein
MLHRFIPSHLKLVKMIATVLLASAMLVSGQTTSTSILGTVTDPSGAPISGADVTIESVGRGLARQMATNDSGFYSAPALDPGEYNVTVGKSGFKKDVRTAIDLRVNQKLTLDFKLELGADAWQSRIGYQDSWSWPGMESALRKLKSPAIDTVLKMNICIFSCGAGAQPKGYEDVRRYLADQETFTPRLLSAMRETLTSLH